MIRLGIDLNHVLRDINTKFYQQYCDAKAMRYQISAEKLRNIDVYNDDTFFKFKSRKERVDFMFNNSYEIFGCATTVEPNLKGKFNFWLSKVVDYFEDEEVEIVALVPSEGGAALSSSLVFLGKGFQFREVWLPKDSKECWKRCDAIVTATPRIIENCPDDKVVIKITRKFNEGLESDMTYEMFSRLLKDEDFLATLVKTINNKRNNSFFYKWINRQKKQLRILRMRLAEWTGRKTRC